MWFHSCALRRKRDFVETILVVIHLTDLLSVSTKKIKHLKVFLASCLVSTVFSSRTFYTERTKWHPHWHCFKTLTLREILRTRNRLQVERCVLFGSLLFVPKSWMCKKQTCVSHSSTESENYFSWCRFTDGRYSPRLISGIWLLMWYIQNRIRHTEINWHGETRCITKRPFCARVRKTRHQFLTNILNCPMSILFPQTRILGAFLYIFEDNEAVIKMIIKSRSPTLRLVFRTHTIALDWLFDRINLDTQDRNQIHWHQEPTRRHTDRRKLHTWWMEHQPFQLSMLLSSHVEEVARRWLRREDCRQIETSGKFGIETPCRVLNSAIFDGIFSPENFGSESHDVGLKASTVRPVTQNPVTDIDVETSRGYNLLSAESVSFRKRVETRLRVMLNCPPGDKMEDIDKHCLIWRIFLSSSMNAAVFLGRDYSEILHSIRRIKVRDQL